MNDESQDVRQPGHGVAHTHSSRGCGVNGGLGRSGGAPLACDDAWNTEHRAEAPLQRADRNFTELLQELRVAQTGVLTLSFMDRFAAIDAFQRGVYVFTLVASAITAALLIAPVAVHRLLFQRGRKRELVRVGHRFALTGLLSLAATMLAGRLLVLDVVVRRIAALSVIAALAVVFVALWVGVPLRLRQDRTTRS